MRTSPITVSAPAKINLYLDMCGRRPDGFHNIDTIFLTVNLCDTLRICPIRRPGIQLVVTGPYRKYVPSNNRNIVYQALEKVWKKWGGDRGVKITLTKNIPVGAGLGGGSSDAAAVIRTVPRLFGKKVSDDEMMRVARHIGSDVPFFIKGGCARGTGRGNIITPITGVQVLWIVLVYPGFLSSTAEAYRLLKGKKALTMKGNINSIIKSLRTHKHPRTWGKYLFNRFEKDIFRRYPLTRYLGDGLRKAGADAVLLSGSGSSVFALTSSRRKAQSIAGHVRSMVKRSGNAALWIVRSFNQHQ